MVEDPSPPDLTTVANWIRETRDEVDMTLTELGDRAQLSPSQLSRLENADGNPSYEAVYRVYTALVHERGSQSVADILATKQDTHAGLRFEHVNPTDSCETAKRLLDEYDISQLPVLKDGQAIGGLTDTDLIDVTGDLEATAVSEVAGPPFPEVSVRTDQTTVRSLLQANPAVLLIIDGESVETADGAIEVDPEVGSYVGLVTAADFR